MDEFKENKIQCDKEYTSNSGGAIYSIAGVSKFKPDGQEEIYIEERSYIAEAILKTKGTLN